ncbi:MULTISPECIES: type II secretion system minor pseudopilin GspK [unclassified Legionella]|uniref:type II secretion system minor pseudopilin GspK n=1 Tax=unclassified Legionella TaxID=2622702 RepID=UPI001054D0F1|nr:MULTISPECIES: type II secretion system minor pseudopilin GspK [unclassified Legionella]MDI9819495.1 type II secretion system minor pseudopilin GspK [Legionella sp. PL877]
MLKNSRKKLIEAPSATLGSALISALFIMTLVAIAATAMSTRLQLDIYRTRLTITSDKLYLASQAVSFWAMSELADKKNRFTLSKLEGEVLSFPEKLQTLYPEIKIKGSIYDLQSRFNLNNLIDKKYQTTFLKLLDFTKLTSSQKEGLILAIHHWISPYLPGRGQDELMNYYLQQKPSYLPGQQLMQTLSEFRLIKDVNATLYLSLVNFITVLPETTPINLNTASKQVLAALGNGLNDAELNELIMARGEEGIQDLKDISPLLQKLNIRQEQITIESHYFLNVATAISEDLTLTKYTILKRHKDKNGNLSVTIINESLNSPW